MTVRIDSFGQSETRTARESLRDADQELEFASLLGSSVILDEQSKGGARGPLAVVQEQGFKPSEASVVIRKSHEVLGDGIGDGSGSSRGARLRSEATERRQEAEVLHSEADLIERRANSNDGALSETVKRDLLNEAELLRSRADDLEQEAEAFDKRADAADERAGVRRVNGPADAAPGSTIVEPSDVGWLSEEELEAFEVALSQVVSEDLGSFENIEVGSSRMANESEIEVFLSVAKQMGASEEDLMVLDGFTDAFPIQIVFVDNLISEYGVNTAAGGAVNVLGTATILMDSSFRSDDLTTAGPDGLPGVVGKGFEDLIFSFSVIVEGVELFQTSAEDFVYEEIEDNEERANTARAAFHREESSDEGHRVRNGVSDIGDTDPDA